MAAIHLLTLLACGCVSLSPASMAAPQCHSNAGFHVAMQPYPEDAGNRFAVTRLKGPAPSKCLFDAAKADFVIGKNGDPLWYGELAGNSLIVSRSTGPQGDLVVYDLLTAKPILDVPSDEYVLKDQLISFWERTVPATAANCPSFAENTGNGLNSVTAIRKTFDLETRVIKGTGESKCVAVQ
jgi:hypothetical protein